MGHIGDADTSVQHYFDGRAASLLLGIGPGKVRRLAEARGVEAVGAVRDRWTGRVVGGKRLYTEHDLRLLSGKVWRDNAKAARIALRPHMKRSATWRPRVKLRALVERARDEVKHAVRMRALRRDATVAERRLRKRGIGVARLIPAPVKIRRSWVDGDA